MTRDSPTRRSAVLSRVPADRLDLWLMLALTFSTGIVDAVGFLGLDRVFTGNMTGDVVVLGGAMGLQAATARVVAVKDVTTVVVTSTITGLAADNPFRRGGRAAGLTRTSAVVVLLGGALLGALLVLWRPGSGLVLAGAICLVVALVGSAGLSSRTRVPEERRGTPVR